MPRPAYQIQTEKDAQLAIQWIERKFSNRQFLTDKTEQRNNSHQQPYRTRARRHWNLCKEGDPTKVQHWCDRWLDPSDWQRLCNVIRSHHSYQRHRDRRHKIQLGEEAWRMLNRLASAELLTHEQVILKYLNNPYQELNRS